MIPDPAALLPIALQAAEVAGELIRTRRPASLTEKSDRDLVSDVDITIERAIRGFLADATPGAGFLGEEEGGTTSPGDGWLWTLDPIDGTSNYAHRIPLCAASLALLRDGHPVLGVIDAPFLGERYHAAEGHGAWSGTRRMTASGTTSLRDAIVAIGDYATGTGAVRKNEIRLAATTQLASRVHRIRMIGTAALDLAWVADGRLDASITLSNLPWDMAAGVIIAREAGAAITDTDGTPHTLQSEAVIAAPELLISQLLPLIQAASIPDPDPKDPATSPYAPLDAILSQARYLIFEFDGPVRDPATDSPAGYIHDAIAACRDSGRIPAVISRNSRPSATAFLDKHDLTGHVRAITAANGHAAGEPQASPQLLEHAIRCLGASPEECALITAKTTGIGIARTSGAHAIGYATTPGRGQGLTRAGASCVIQSLADLTLRLRARPLPN